MPDLDSEALDFRAASESFAVVRKFRCTELETLPLVARKVDQIPSLTMVGLVTLSVLQACATARPAPSWR